MKQFFILAFSAFVILSCNDTADGDNDTRDTTTTSNTRDDDDDNLIEVSNQIYQGMKNGDSALLRKYIAEDAIDHGGNPDGSDARGAQIISMLSSVKTNIPDVNIEVIEQSANDDHVFALVRMTGTLKNAFWGMPAGHKMDSRSVDLIKIKDGKATEHWSFLDPAEMMKMMQAQQGGNTANRDTTKR